MHSLCSEVTYQRFAGTAVERDFVEAPSQMLENWVYESEPLLMMSDYVDDKTKKIPQEMIYEYSVRQFH
jgi:thimet oligopeptidase